MKGAGKGRESNRERQSSFRSLAFLLLIPLAAFGLYHAATSVLDVAGVGSSQLPAIPERGPADTTPKGTRKGSPEGKNPTERSSTAAAQERRAGDKRIVLILDDVGFGGQPLEEATRIDPNLNFAVIPGESHSRQSARTLEAGGFEILCHLPMEPLGYPGVSPGNRAILNAMTNDQIRAQVKENFRLVPEARGFNNHMGSRGTADRRIMEQVFAAMPPDLFFVDSRTTSASLAGGVAREMNIRTASRDVFLDDKQDQQSIRKQLAELASLAEKRKLAIGIGHMYPSTIKVLSEEMPKLRQRGFRFIRASEAVN